MRKKNIFKTFLFSIICLLLLKGLKSQSRWSKVYYDDRDAIGNAIINSYDNGMLIVGKHGSNAVEFNWLIKTNVNGEIIWEKTIGAQGTNIKISDMAFNKGGEIFLVGLTGYYNEDDYDPLIMKLNACGEKEWCAVFYEPENNNFANEVLATEDGGCVAILRYMNADLKEDRICLTKIDVGGNMLWKQCYNSSDTSLHNEDAYDLTMTPDKGFLITGYCSYTSPEPPHGWWYKPYYIKTDSLGNFEWEKVVHSQATDRGGHAWTTTIDPDSNFLWSSLTQRYYNFRTEYAPALLKMEFSGKIVDIYDLAPPNRYGSMIEAKFCNDTTLVASVYTGTESSYPEAVIIDTVGNILKQKELLPNERLAMTQVTFDKKLLFFVNMLNEDDDFDAYLFKLNQSLESDTIYTQQFNYDSLCDGEIISDTIVQDDCGLIVGDLEIYMPQVENERELVIYPNPTKNKFKVQSLMFEFGGCNIEIFDLFGRKLEEIQVPNGQTGLEVNTIGWQKGLHVVRVINNMGNISTAKVVIR